MTVLTVMPRPSERRVRGRPGTSPRLADVVRPSRSLPDARPGQETGREPAQLAQ